MRRFSCEASLGQRFFQTDRFLLIPTPESEDPDREHWDALMSGLRLVRSRRLAGLL